MTSLEQAVDDGDAQLDEIMAGIDLRDPDGDLISFRQYMRLVDEGGTVVAKTQHGDEEISTVWVPFSGGKTVFETAVVTDERIEPICCYATREEAVVGHAVIVGFCRINRPLPQLRRYNPARCPQCDREAVFGSEPDPCLGRLDGVRSACCGHAGRTRSLSAYVAFKDGRHLQGPAAVEYFRSLGLNVPDDPGFIDPETCEYTDKYWRAHPGLHPGPRG